jgi:hypothetical protein
MTRATFYPPANRTAAWYAAEYPGVDMGGIEKLLLHSTEGPNWSPFDGGAKRPTLTYHAGIRAWRQHGLLNYSARALQDPTGTPVRENRDKVVQVEIVGTCDPARHKLSPKWPFMPALTDGNLDDLAELLVFLHREWGTPVTAAPLWLPYPASYGPSRARLTSGEYDAAVGVLGHEHASGNSHGDPGNIDASGIVARALLILNPPKLPPAPPTTTTNDEEDEDDMKLRTYGGKTYLFWGLFKREVPPSYVAAALKEFGPARAADTWEMQLRTSLDTLIEIIGDGRVDASDAEEAVKALSDAVRPALTDLGEQVGKAQSLVTAVGSKVDELAARIPAGDPSGSVQPPAGS